MDIRPAPGPARTYDSAAWITKGTFATLREFTPRQKCDQARRTSRASRATSHTSRRTSGASRATFMTTVAITGGSGLTKLKNLRITRREVIRTPYGEPSAPMVYGQLGGREGGV